MIAITQHFLLAGDEIEGRRHTIGSTSRGRIRMMVNVVMSRDTRTPAFNYSSALCIYFPFFARRAQRKD
jgi:hypothetical protein